MKQVSFIAALAVSHLLFASVASAVDVTAPNWSAVYIECKRTGTTTATGSVLEHQGRWYVVTALHALYKAEDAYLKAGIELNADGDQVAKVDERINAGCGDRRIGPEIIYDRQYDIAAIQLYPHMAIMLKNAGVRPLSLPSDNAPVGTAAISVGSPQVRVDNKNLEVPNIVYDCTISDYAKIRDRIPDVLDRNLLSQRDILTLQDQTKLMFLETLSIAPGFSGGPIIDRNTNSTLLGVVIGGVESTSVQAGRFAWACPASEVVRLLDSTQPSDSRYVSYTRFPDTEWEPGVHGPIYKSVQNFSAADRQLISQATIDANMFKDPRIFDSFVNTQGVLYEFRNVTFQGIRFSSSRLMNSRFSQCTFVDCDFSGSILTGARFEECTATAATPQKLKFDPLVAYGALVDIKFSRATNDASRDAAIKFFEEAPAELMLKADEVGELAPASFAIP